MQLLMIDVRGTAKHSATILMKRVGIWSATVEQADRRFLMTWRTFSLVTDENAYPQRGRQAGYLSGTWDPLLGSPESLVFSEQSLKETRIEMTDALIIFLRKFWVIAAGSFKFNDCVEGEIKAVYLVNFLLKPVKCVTVTMLIAPMGWRL